MHCASWQQARQVRDAIAGRLAEVGLELHQHKTKIVYSKDANRTGSLEHEKFTFLGYVFRPRLAKNKHGKQFVSFLPAVSRAAMKAIGAEVRSWYWAKRGEKSLTDLAQIPTASCRGGLVKRYWCRQALTDCTLSVPASR